MSDPKSKQDKVKVTNFKKFTKISNFLILKQSRHDSVHRRTDGQGETSIPPFNFVEGGVEGIVN